MAIKILVVDDHGIMREGLRLLIDQQPGMKMIAGAANGREAADLVRELNPDIVLMDVSMPGLNGIEATGQIIADHPDIKILALSAHSNRRFVTDMLKAGASGYLLKDGIVDELVRAIHAVMTGERYLSSKVAGIIIDDYVGANKPQRKGPSMGILTNRERELLQLLAENKSTKEAAKLLHISIKTVDARRRGIMNKLGITGMADLTKFAIREGLTSLEF